MKEQPHYTNFLTKEFFEKHHLEEKKSMAEISKMLRHNDPPLNITVSTLCKYCDRVEVPRRKSSEARRNWDPDPLDWNVSFETEEMIESLDGFILGDGSIQADSNETIARLRCTQEYQEFTLYQMEPFRMYRPIYCKSKHEKSKNHSPGFYLHGQTKFHPDLYKHYLRWYPIGKGTLKDPPRDVRITPKSVMIWYLGDGSVVDVNNSIALRISTDSFSEKGVEFLAGKLREKGIECHRNNDNRIYIESRGIPKFFEFIGRESPVKCYDYKFKLPEWRLESKRMRDVADDLKIDYQRLAYFVKIGKIAVHRASKNGKPRFMPEHIDALKKMIDSGEFDADGRSS